MYVVVKELILLFLKTHLHASAWSKNFSGPYFKKKQLILPLKPLTLALGD
jgi:hypothetical protein